MRGRLRGLLRWVGGHVRGFYAAVGVFLVAGIVIVLGAALGFAALADSVVEGETLAVDRAILLWMNRHATPERTVIALEITALGAGVVVWMVVLVTSAFLWTSRHRYSVLLLWVSMIGAGLISQSLKMVFDRPRPDLFPWRAPYAPNASFPSGHSTTAMVAYVTLAYLIARLEPSRAMRRLTFVVAGLVIVAIGLSRMYLGVHWPSDVVGGFFTGLAWAAFCALGIEALRYFRTRKPEIVEQEEGLERGAD
ncbi:MAG TPA: phosphatase PAP2 family protein [Longimicrobium sp.]|nr:phosphatase PAP2 family protein [Longimicrobium sp.]